MTLHRSPRLSRGKGPLTEKPGRTVLLSLWEIMERFRVKELIRVIEDLFDEELCFQVGHPTGEPILTEEDVKGVQNVLVEAEATARSLGLLNVAQKIRNSQKYFKDHAEITNAAAETEFRNVREAFNDALEHFQFIKIAKGREIYIERFLLGRKVQDKFPSAVPDISEAKNCLMAGCDTAAVFHLMRVVEWGLRALCVHLGFRKLKSRIRKSGAAVYKPIEYSEWEHILDAIQDRVDAKVKRMKRGSNKQAAQEFYYPALQDIRGIRDAWRNHVMHTRAMYSSSDANAIREHVYRLMVNLARRISEV